MKTSDYINSLIKENENLKSNNKEYLEEIRLLKREIKKNKVENVKKDKKILKLESCNIDIDIKYKKELNTIKSDFDNLNLQFEKIQIEFEELQRKYNSVVKENEEFKIIFNEIEKNGDSD